jgi:hypothetical protein
MAQLVINLVTAGSAESQMTFAFRLSPFVAVLVDLVEFARKLLLSPPHDLCSASLLIIRIHLIL